MGPGGVEGGGVDFLYFIILFMRWKSNEAKGTPNVSIIKYSNTGRNTGRPGSSEVPCNLLTCWDVSSIPANGIFLTKKLKNKTKNKNAQRVEND